MTGSSHLLSLLDEVASVTWRLVEDLDETHLRSQFDPGFSPIGWHLGHIAWQKARFLLGASAHSFKLGPDALWDSFASDKSCRGPQLSDKAKLVAHMREVHERVRNLFHKPHDSLMAERVHFIANHERQHAEIIATNRLLGRLPLAAPLSARAVTDPMPDFESFLKVDATDFIMGADDDIDGWDNERRAHRVRVQSFFIQREPVTCGAGWNSSEQGDIRTRDFGTRTATLGASNPVSARHFIGLGTEAEASSGTRSAASVPLSPEHPCATSAGTRRPRLRALPARACRRKPSGSAPPAGTRIPHRSAAFRGETTCHHRSAARRQAGHRQTWGFASSMPAQERSAPERRRAARAIWPAASGNG
jgi:hypothetical protein